MLGAGRRYANRLVALYVLPRREGPFRLGLAVGKRVGKAVVRNRVKRRLREACRRYRDAVSVSVDAVLVGRPEAGRAEFAALAGAVADLFGQAGLVSTKKEAGG